MPILSRGQLMHVVQQAFFGFFNDPTWFRASVIDQLDLIADFWDYRGVHNKVRCGCFAIVCVVVVF